MTSNKFNATDEFSQVPLTVFLYVWECKIQHWKHNLQRLIRAHAQSHALKDVLDAAYADILVQVRRQSGQDWRAEKCHIFKHVWQMKPSLTFEGALTGCRDWTVQNNPTPVKCQSSSAITQVIIQLSFPSNFGKDGETRGKWCVNRQPWNLFFFPLATIEIKHWWIWVIKCPWSLLVGKLFLHLSFTCE